MGGPCNRNGDARVEMVHKWFEVSDINGSFIGVSLVDYSKAFTVFDLINHGILMHRLSNVAISPFMARWVARFL